MRAIITTASRGKRIASCKAVMVQQSSAFSSLSFVSSTRSILLNNTTANIVTAHENRNPLTSSSQKRTLFIQTESTPNPESIKFIPGRPVLVLSEDDESSTTGFYVTRNDPKIEIARSPLSQNLFSQVEGIKSIYLGHDFVTVTKYAEAKWDHIKTPVFSVIMDHYAQNENAALLSEPLVTDTTILEDDDEVVAMIKELLETRIRPAVQEDGGDIRYVGFNETSGIVSVQLAGSCVGCPSSSVTLKNGVENMLMHYIPEVLGVESIEEEEDGEIGDVVVESTEAKTQKTYEERLKAAGIPFSD